MASEKSPAFQFYPKDFLSDEQQAAMPAAAAGVYIRLLCHCWMEGSLPSDMTVLARLGGVTKVQLNHLWSALSPCFQPQADGRLIQRRLERERQKQDTWRAMKAAAGKKGGQATQQKAKQKASRHQAERQAESSPPSSSSTNVRTQTVLEQQSVALALPKPAPTVTEFLTWFQAEYKSRRDGAIYCVVWAKHGAIVKRLLRTHALERLKKHAVLLLSATVDEWIDESDRGIEVLAAKINWLEERLASWEKQHDA